MSDARIVDLIYDAVVDDSAMSPLSLAIADHVHADSGWMLSGVRGADGPIAAGAHGLDDDVVRAYQTEFHRHDPWTTVVGRAPVGTPVLLDRWVSCQDFLASRVYRDLVRGRADILHCMAVLFSEEGALTSYAFQRGRRARPFDEADRLRLAPLVPHLRRLAIALRRQVTAAQPTLEAMVDHPDPVILCDRAARPVHCSAQGTAMLDAGRVLARAGNGRIRCVDPALAIAGPIREAAVRQVPSVHRIDPPVGPQIVAIDPCRQRPFHAVVTVRDTRGHARRKTRRAATLFDLTAAEEALLTSLLLGLTPEEHCTGRCIALSTARSQLRSLFAKTGTERQSELILRVLEPPTR